METDKPTFPKKAFLSRARSSSTSISSGGASSSDLALHGSRTYSGLDLLAEGSEMLANRQIKDLRDDAADASGSFSKRHRDDSLSYASLPDEMKVSFSELEDTGINLDDLNFNACPQLIEDAAPSNVTLDLTPKPDDLVETEADIMQVNPGVSSTSCTDEYRNSNSDTRFAQNAKSCSGKDPNGRDSDNLNAAPRSNPISRSETEYQSSVISSNSSGRNQASRSDSSSGSIKMNKAGGTGSRSAGSNVSSLIQASSRAVNDNQSWDTVTELPWADDRLMEEISQVCGLVSLR